MVRPASSLPPHDPPWLRPARWLVLSICALALLVFASGLPALYRHALVLAHAYDSTLPPRTAARVFVATGLVALPTFVLVAALLLWRRPHDPIALAAALMLVLTAVLHNDAAIESPAPVWIVAVVLALTETSQLLFLWLFPSGRFVPAYTRWFLGPIFLWRLLIWGLLYLPRYHALPLDAIAPGAVPLAPLDLLLILGCCAQATHAQVRRYRRVSTAVERQQTKWVLFAIVIVVVVIGVGTFLINGLGWLQPGTADGLLALLVVRSLTQLALLTLPAALLLAILRYRLFAIDRVINRTLVYSSVTGLLLVVYGASVLILQHLVGLLLGQARTDLVLVSSTLTIAALFQPLRHRVQRGIDRRFYRRTYDATRTIAAFSASLRDEVDIDRLRTGLLAVVEETMRPAHLSLWLRDREHRPDDPAPPRHPHGEGTDARRAD
jgi:hypothetical protein